MIDFVVSSVWNCCQEQLKFTPIAYIKLLGIMLIQSLKCILCYTSNLFLKKSYRKELNLDTKCFSHAKGRNSGYIYIYIYIYI